VERFSNILCCTDFSDRSEMAFDKAVALAQRENATLTLLHVVVPNTPLLPGNHVKPNKKTPQDVMAQRISNFVEEHYRPRALGQEFKLAIRRGHPMVEILEHIKENDNDLVVVGSEGLQGVGLYVLGSVAERISRNAPCSCLVVR
jgi:nucleotide-binding universal stress UspA family protein